MRCQSCGQIDTLVPIGTETRDVTWPNGDVYQVTQSRCLACGAREIISRDWAKKHEKDEAITGRYMEADGRQIHVRLLQRG